MKRLLCSAIVVSSHLAAASAFADPPKPRAKRTASVDVRPLAGKQVDGEAQPGPADNSLGMPSPAAAQAMPLAVICTPASPTVLAAMPPSTAPSQAQPEAPAPTPQAEPKADPDKTPERAAPVEGWRAEALLGHAAKDLGIGVGLRFGRTSKKRVFVGGSAMYQAAKAEDVHVTYASAELGYELRVGDIELMPYLGAGSIAAIHPESTYSDGKTTKDTAVDVSPLVYPGLVARYDVPSTALSVGADGRMLYVTDSDVAALAFHATAGFRF